ncbi:MAG: glycerophosphodiester phosphodiesterase, partial [Candidatus Brocadiae bacterium]|nr:glycerophosphodiester phosphodiesterase [Candidatus Brocadiia bacterium]
MVEVVGHRGAAGVEPENTLRGFRLAVELGADWTECDVHLTKDGRPVVMHDETVDRTTDGEGPVDSFSWAELRKLDAGGWFAGEYAGERVPGLEEVLEFARGKARLCVEIKGRTNE